MRCHQLILGSLSFNITAAKITILCVVCIVCTHVDIPIIASIQFITEMADKISDKMTSALLAMSLSYYYVMGEHIGKEKRIDEILSTLLSWTDDKTYMNTTRMTKGVS